MDPSNALKLIASSTSKQDVEKVVSQLLDALITFENIKQVQQLIRGERKNSIFFFPASFEKNVTLALQVLVIEEKITENDMIRKLERVLYIVLEPRNKVECITVEYFSHFFRNVRESEITQNQQIIMRIYQCNRNSLGGLIHAAESVDHKMLPIVVCVLGPLFHDVLMHSGEAIGKKYTILQLLNRFAWQGEEIKCSVLQIFSHILVLFPNAVHLEDDSLFLSDFLRTGLELAFSLENLSKMKEFLLDMCEFLLSRIHDASENDTLGGIMIFMHLMERIISEVPDILWSWDVKRSPALLLSLGLQLIQMDGCIGYQEILLNVIGTVMDFARLQGKRKRVVYCELLLPPLLSVVTILPISKSIIQDLLYILSFRKVCLSDSYKPRSWSFALLALLDRVNSSVLQQQRRVCSWIRNITQECIVTKSKSDRIKLIFLIVVGLLFDDRHNVRMDASTLLEGLVASAEFNSSSSDPLINLIGTSISCLLSLHSVTDDCSDWTNRLLHLLPSIAVTSKQNMKVMIRVGKTMQTYIALKPMALRLIYGLWMKEKRVFPILETFLQEETLFLDNKELHICKIATLADICNEDPDKGVNFLKIIQTYLEDENSVAAAVLALKSVNSLCIADALDFYATYRIVYSKIKKKKIFCVQHTLFLSELCRFYGLGSAEFEENREYGDKILDFLWELTQHENSNVRAQALAALNRFEVPRLCVLNDQEDVDEEDLERIVERVDTLMTLLESEEDRKARDELELLLERILIHESAHFPSLKTQKNQLTSDKSTKRELQKLFERTGDLNQCFQCNDVLEAARKLYLLQIKQMDMTQLKRKDRAIKGLSSLIEDSEENMLNILNNISQVKLKCFDQGNWLLSAMQATFSDYVKLLREYSLLLLDSSLESKSSRLNEASWNLLTEKMVTCFSSKIRNKSMARLVNSVLLAEFGRMCVGFATLLNVQGTVMNILMVHLDEVEAFGKTNQMSGQMNICLLGILAVTEQNTLTSLNLSEIRGIFERLERIIMSLNYEGEDASIAYSITVLALGRFGKELLLPKQTSLRSAAVEEYRDLFHRICHLLLELLLRHTVLNPKEVNIQVFSDRKTFLDLSTLQIQTNIEQCAVRSSQALAIICGNFVTFGFPWWLHNLHVLLKSMVDEGAVELFGSLVSVSLKCLSYEVMSISDMLSLAIEGLNIAVKNKLRSTEVLSHVGLLLNQLGTMLECLPCELINQFVTVLTQCGAAGDSERQKSDVIVAIGNALSLSFGHETITSKENLFLWLDSDRLNELIGLLASMATKSPDTSSYATLVMCALKRKFLSEMFCVETPKRTLENQVLPYNQQSFLYRTIDFLRKTKLRVHLEDVSNKVGSLLHCLAPVECTPAVSYASLLTSFIKQGLGKSMGVEIVLFASKQCRKDPISLPCFLLDLFTTEHFVQLDKGVQHALVLSIAEKSFIQELPSSSLYVLMENLRYSMKLSWESDCLSAKKLVVSFLIQLHLYLAKFKLEDSSSNMIKAWILEELFEFIPHDSEMVKDTWEIYESYANLLAILEPSVARGKIIKTFETEHKPTICKASFLLALLVQKNFLPRSDLKILFGFLCSQEAGEYFSKQLTGVVGSIIGNSVRKSEQTMWLLDLLDELGRQHGKSQNFHLLEILAQSLVYWNKDDTTKLLLRHQSFVSIIPFEMTYFLLTSSDAVITGVREKLEASNAEGSVEVIISRILENGMIHGLWRRK